MPWLQKHSYGTTALYESCIALYCMKNLIRRSFLLFPLFSRLSVYKWDELSGLTVSSSTDIKHSHLMSHYTKCGYCDASNIKCRQIPSTCLCLCSWRYDRSFLRGPSGSPISFRSPSSHIIYTCNIYRVNQKKVSPSVFCRFLRNGLEF